MQQCIDNTVPKWKVQPELNAHTERQREERERERRREKRGGGRGVWWFDVQITVWEKVGERRGNSGETKEALGCHCRLNMR